MAKTLIFHPFWGAQAMPSWWLNHPSEKYARQIGSFPQKVRDEHTNIFETTT